MKKLILFLAVLGLSTSAFAAQTYYCELPKDKNGEAVMGGPGYSVKIDGQDVILVRTNGTVRVARTTEVTMTKETQEPDGAVYKADNVRAMIVVTPIGGKLRTIVSIEVKLGRDVFNASCIEAEKAEE